MAMTRRDVMENKMAEAERKAKLRRRVLLDGISAEALEFIAEYVEAGLPVFRTHDTEGRLRVDVNPEMLQLDAARRDGKLCVYYWLLKQRELAERDER